MDVCASSGPDWAQRCRSISTSQRNMFHTSVQGTVALPWGNAGLAQKAGQMLSWLLQQMSEDGWSECMVSNVGKGFWIFPHSEPKQGQGKDVAQSFSLTEWERTTFAMRSFKNHLGRAPIYIVPCCRAI